MTEQEFLAELDRLVDELGLSQGELLALAREVAGRATLRTVDRLTGGERRELLLRLQELRLRYCVAV